jgi:hypothetical protein
MRPPDAISRCIQDGTPAARDVPVTHHALRWVANLVSRTGAIMLTSSLLRAFAVTVALSSALQAQTAGTDSSSSDLIRRSSATLSVIQSRPQGAFSANVGLGYGLDGAYLLRLDDAGIWSLRANVGVIGYGDESRRTALSESIGGRVNVDVTTTNYIMPMIIGPQLTWPTGAVRPYANAGVGGQAFFTESQVKGTTTGSIIASTTNHSSFVGSWSVGGGVYLPVYAGKTRVEFDLGAQYVSGGSARYLSRNSIIDLPNSQVSITPFESTTHVLLVRIGGRVGL